MGRGGKTDPLETLAKLKETTTTLQKREELLWKRVGEEVEKAKDFTRQKNKRAALQCLKRKKMLETQADQLSNNIMRVQEQIDLLESSSMAVTTVQALKEGADAMKAQMRENKIEDVDKVMDEINEHTDNMRAIQDALGTPLSNSVDEDDLLAELAELEEMQEEEEAREFDAQLLAPAVPTTKAGARLAVKPVPVSLPMAPARSAEEDELAALEAEMALA